MFKTLRDKITVSGIAVLMIGVALLIFTFVSAYGFLTQGLSIITTGDLTRTFGEALAPLIATCIHIMYLGVMVWIGSLLTIRGVTILSQARQTPELPRLQQTSVKEEPKLIPKAKEEKAPREIREAEAKPCEPEIVVLTPEKVSQTQQEPQQAQTENK